jgi:hypothetical protein
MLTLTLYTGESPGASTMGHKVFSLKIMSERKATFTQEVFKTYVKRITQEVINNKC